MPVKKPTAKTAAEPAKKSTASKTKTKAAKVVKAATDKPVKKVAVARKTTTAKAPAKPKAASAKAKPATALAKPKATPKKVSSTTAKAKAPAKAKPAVAKPKAAAKTTRAKTVATTKKPTATRPVARRRTTATAPKPRVVRQAVAERALKPEAEIAPLAPTDVREQFFHEHRAAHVAESQRDVPVEYGDTKIVLLVRDPEWVFAYWEVNDATRQELKIPRGGHERKMVIRLYKIDGRNWPEEAAHYFFDTEIGPYSNNWYLRVPETAADWCAELGMYDDQGNYIVIVRSNRINTPRGTMSDHVDSEWMTVEETYRELYGLSGGFTLRERRGSEEILRNLQKQLDLSARGESLSSGMMTSGAWAGKTESAVKDFWLQVHTELILYGATEPDATVTVQGREVKLNPDGTFSLRFALPDGEQTLPVHATSANGTMERSITPVVKKNTR
ncbi:MAG: DUF4912 domain-containing protein [Candidatus Sumerlaeaceae bacterium]|nr:DUF4912 domain-containing protein [Candidatus Sumerlaeaceae bacterium]